MTHEQKIGPKDPRPEIAQHAVCLMNRLRQAFPAFFENYSVDKVVIKFSQPLSEHQSAITTVYENMELTEIHINPHLTSLMHDELDEVQFIDLVRTNIGIAICLDAVFQKLLDEKFYDPRVTEALSSILMDRVLPLSKLKEIFGTQNDCSGYIEKTWDQMISDRVGGLNTDLIARINAQRLAFGMVLAAEETKYGAEESKSLRDASRHYIVERIRGHARKLAFIGFALTNDLTTSISGATKQLLTPDVVPFAIPFDPEDIKHLINSMKKAQHSYEYPYDEAQILDLSDGIPPPGLI